MAIIDGVVEFIISTTHLRMKRIMKVGMGLSKFTQKKKENIAL